MHITNRGQISLDLILTLLVTIIFLTSMAYFVTDFGRSQNNILLDNQLKTISSDLATQITATNALSETDFELRLKIPRIIFEEKFDTPTIFITNNKIIASYNDINEESYFSENNSVINKRIENGYLVISK